MSDQRPGSFQRVTASEINSIVGVTPSPPGGNPDGIDRIKELLASAIDLGYSHIEQVRRAIDRIAGNNEPKADNPIGSLPSMPPLSNRTVYNLLGDLENMQRQMSVQLTRIREQLP